MSRPPKCRRIAEQARPCAFKPAGVPGQQLETIELGLDELEALRLADVEGLYFDAAAAQMGVSRPTFGRLIERARHKVARALVQSKMLVFQGGPVMSANLRTFECRACGAQFQVSHGTGRPAACPQCQSQDFHRAVEDRGPAGIGQGGAERGRCNRRRRGWAQRTAQTAAPGAKQEKAE